MSIDKMTKEELELLSYKDITNLLLTEKGKMNTGELFRKIVDLLELSENIFATKIGDYYTSLTTDKRFILLDDGNWDLKSHHTSDKIVKIIEEDEEEELDDLKDESEGSEPEEDDYDSDKDDDDSFDDEDDLKDLVVLDEDELELEE